MQYGHGQTMTMTQDQRKALIEYCIEHADRPNPIQDLIDKGLIPSYITGQTCASVKQAHDNEQTRIREEIENQNRPLKEKYLKYHECMENVTTLPKDCRGIISYDEMMNLFYNGSLFQ
jgi:hypothetical protein